MIEVYIVSNLTTTSNVYTVYVQYVYMCISETMYM